MALVSEILGYPYTAEARERRSLVRLCARLTGDADAAEDLAQEALLEAWRHEAALRDPQKRAQWLAGIARNVCLRWGQRRGRERDLLERLGGASGALALVSGEAATSPCIPEVELERDELAYLLDRALALLPPATREVLVARYIEEFSHGEIAERLRLSEGAVKVRLHRGRLALRRVLTTALRHEVAAYGPYTDEPGGWRETRIWCPDCGERRLLGDFDRAIGRLLLRCPGCYLVGPDGFNSRHEDPELFAGIRGYKPAFSRVLTAGADYFVAALARRSAPCSCCGGDTPLRFGTPEHVESWRQTPFAMYATCARCLRTTDFSLRGLAHALPQARHFWQRHPRMRTLPLRGVEHQGEAALVITLESVAERATLDIIAARDTFRFLYVDGAPFAWSGPTATVGRGARG